MSLEVSYKSICEFVSFLRYEVDTEPGDLNLLCLQGVTPVGGTPTKIGSNVLEQNDNAPDQQNDAIILFGRTDDDEEYVHCLVGTIDPGRYYTQTSPNPKGAAHLTFGQHLYKKGLHQGNTSKPALRSLNEVNRVWRDKNGNFKLDPSELIFEGVYGTNVHAGSKTRYVGKYSAGCINVGGGYQGLPYLQFMRRVDEHSADKEMIRVNIWRGRDLFTFEEKGWDFKPTLLPGMKGGWVAELQRLLVKTGAFLTPDGDWRDKTTIAVMEFQNNMRLKQDGWVGPTTWMQLEFVAG